MSEDSQEKSQKTEQPTEHRIEKALEKGQIPLSREITNFLGLFSIACLVLWVFPGAFRKLLSYFSASLENLDYFPQTPVEFQGFSTRITLEILGFCAIPFAVLIIAALAGSGLQTRFRFTGETLKPKGEKLSPLKGLERLFGIKALVEFTKNIFKLVVIAGIAWMVLWPERRMVPLYATLSMDGFLKTLDTLTTRFLAWILSILAIVGILDYLYQRFMWLQNLKMSHQDIKEERKEMEGDPQIKSRIRQLRMSRARQRIMAEVPKATVLITNPTHFAVALKYETGITSAPVVIARGRDFMALKMREIAAEHNVPIVENRPLAQALFRDVREGDEIPFEHYEAVAKIIRYILHKR